LKILYYKLAKDAGVSSSLMAPRNKGEGEGSENCQGTFHANNVTQKFQIMFMHLEDQNLLREKE